MSLIDQMKGVLSDRKRLAIVVTGTAVLIVLLLVAALTQCGKGQPEKLVTENGELADTYGVVTDDTPVTQEKDAKKEGASAADGSKEKDDQGAGDSSSAGNGSGANVGSSQGQSVDGSTGGNNDGGASNGSGSSQSGDSGSTGDSSGAGKSDNSGSKSESKGGSSGSSKSGDNGSKNDGSKSSPSSDWEVGKSGDGSEPPRPDDGMSLPPIPTRE